MFHSCILDHHYLPYVTMCLETHLPLLTIGVEGFKVLIVCLILSVLTAPVAICFANNLAYPLLMKTDLPSFIMGAFVFSFIGCGVPVAFLFLSLYFL